MCGIAGILTSGSLDLRRHIVPMCNALRHRGPDDEGVLVADGSWAIGNCRLAIRDTSPAGHMPMCTPDGAIATTYNAEIYNADVLRNGLKDLGGTFRSHSTPEVIRHGYSRWGPAIVEKLNGIFA